MRWVDGSGKSATGPRAASRDRNFPHLSEAIERQLYFNCSSQLRIEARTILKSAEAKCAGNSGVFDYPNFRLSSGLPAARPEVPGRFTCQDEARSTADSHIGWQFGSLLIKWLMSSGLVWCVGENSGSRGREPETPRAACFASRYCSPMKTRSFCYIFTSFGRVFARCEAGIPKPPLAVIVHI